ncbi:MAG: helix-turn-helix domain-containing protein [Candidatus Eisenbacteria bacterium]|nr:helix-turn-helix domain-containing protein [Candidatus Eisenbacteria bacterium]MCC7144310.1 helix-turn-helix domain-containing protein [Candidatus Eisenbacteria bacterium]
MDRGFTQSTLASRLGRTARAVADWESGLTKPLASSWGLIAEVLGADLLPDGADIEARVWSARWRLGLTRAELAEKVGLDPRTIRNVEQERYRPSHESLRRLWSVLGSHPFPRDSSLARW